MNKNTDMEKLEIEPDKIIHILLKHLMDLKNENAFLKNYANLHSSENGIPRNRLGINNVPDGIPKNRVGIKNVLKGIPKNRVGIKNVPEAIPKNRVGIKHVPEGIPKNRVGIKYTFNVIPKNRVGINNVTEDIPKNRVGIKYIFNGIPEDRVGIKYISEALSNSSSDTNRNSLLHSVFEEELIKAMDEYLKNGDGQTTLFTFYSDFVDAVAEQNSADSKAKDAAANLRLEDTHFVPSDISHKNESYDKLESGLKRHLPRYAGKGIHRTVAIELLQIQRTGKATGTELRDCSGLSVAGFAKHLPKLIAYNLIKKQAPLNYVLTDYAQHILLELFGVPKTSLK